MIDWRQGGWAGSINRWVDAEVRKHLQSNQMALQVRYGFGMRALRRFFGIGSFGRFVALYALIDLTFVAIETLAAWTTPAWFSVWEPFGSIPAVKAIVPNVSGYLINMQLGVLGILSLALALVALIAQREGSSTDVQLYYHESLSFELVASCMALLTALCFQLLWPLQFVLHRVLPAADSQVFRLGLVGVHLAWLLLNLWAVAYFIATTFGFVQQSVRERLRERYTARAVLPREMTRRLRQELYGLAASELTGGRDEDDAWSTQPTVMLGVDLGEPEVVEIETDFVSPSALCDVRAIWAGWVINRWIARSASRKKARDEGLLGFVNKSPVLWFTPHLDQPMRGKVGWCRRRGGVPLTRLEKLVLRLAFRFGKPPANDTLPNPGEILEELADQTAGQIDRLAPVAFDKAFGEMVRYHRFLLALNASRSAEGAAFNYAEVAGYAWNAPHHHWVRQYRRLFDRAMEKLPEDDHFVSLLSATPGQLLSRPGDPELSPNVVRSILDIQSIMIHRVEAWRMRRVADAVREAMDLSSRTVLPPSDAVAYRNALREMVGAWEGILQRVPSIYAWRAKGDQDATASWSAFAASWPLLWQHLSNTAYCLAVAVWAEDEVGSALFRESLTRWSNELSYCLEEPAELRWGRLLFPDTLELNWSEAHARAQTLGYDYVPPRPSQLFAGILRRAHDDVLLLTTAVLLLWTTSEKQPSGMGGDIASALLRRDGGDEHDPRTGRQPGFRSLFLDILRLGMAGERFRGRSHAAELDGFVQRLDNMTERPVVPGRIFEPSTLMGSADLLHSFGVMLAAVAPTDGDDGFISRVSELAEAEDILPERDRTLRNLIEQLNRFRASFEQPGAWLVRGLASLTPDRNADWAAGRVRDILHGTVTVIEDVRLKRLKTRPVDFAKLERLRSAIEAALLNKPSKAPFFRDVRIYQSASSEGAAERDILFSDFRKAQLTEPEMEATPGGFEENIATVCCNQAGTDAWHAFKRRTRAPVRACAGLQEEAFWRQITPLAAQVGLDPVLVLSQKEGRAMRKMARADPADRLPIRIERRANSDTGGTYLATVEGIDVVAAGFSSGVAWLFSARALRSVTYASVDDLGHHVSVLFDPGEQLIGALQVRIRRSFDWSDAPIFEISFPGESNSDPDS